MAKVSPIALKASEQRCLKAIIKKNAVGVNEIGRKQTGPVRHRGFDPCGDRLMMDKLWQSMNGAGPHAVVVLGLGASPPTRLIRDDFTLTGILFLKRPIFPVCPTAPAKVFPKHADNALNSG